VKTVVLATDTPERFDAAVARAAQLLRQGKLVALPTETVYGLAANALDAAAVARIFKVKGRPPHNPIIVHVAGLEMARRCVTQWPPAAAKLAKAFWPGPLTLVLPRAGEIPEAVAAGGPTVGIRWPSHPLIEAVIRACGFPLAAPSANLASKLSATTIGHVRKDFEGKIPLIVDGGQPQVGIESSVLDLVSSPPRLLRPGMVHVESLVAVLHQKVLEGPAGAELGAASTAPRSPGMLERHYSPNAKLVLLRWHDDAELAARLAEFKIPPAKVHLLVYHSIPTTLSLARVAVAPDDAQAFARALYAELHRCDEEGAELIVVEKPPQEPAWRAISDRLARAAAGEAPIHLARAQPADVTAFPGNVAV
jgi:L-threonylcarbamoyladenylate synthase